MLNSIQADNIEGIIKKLELEVIWEASRDDTTNDLIIDNRVSQSCGYSSALFSSLLWNEISTMSMRLNFDAIDTRAYL